MFDAVMMNLNKYNEQYSAMEAKVQATPNIAERSLPSQQQNLFFLNPCGHCRKVEGRKGEFKRCSQCKQVAYCSRDCQKADWKSHKAACAASVAAEAKYKHRHRYKHRHPS
jgi:hypothetical protein